MKKITHPDQKLPWQEHIRKRPGMYVGRVSIKGFTDAILDAFSVGLEKANPEAISINLNSTRSFQLVYKNIKTEILDHLAVVIEPLSRDNNLGLVSLNALSEKFKIEFFDTNAIPFYTQVFEKGYLQSGEISGKLLHVETLSFDVQLDSKIWGNDFVLNENYLSDQLREFAFFYKNIKFELQYEVDKTPCHVIYHFKGGLNDRLTIEKLKGLGSTFFDSYFDHSFGDFSLEVAFAFREYTVDEPILKSYVNDFYTHENGTHVDGLLQGLTFGVMKYFQKHQLTDVYRISEKGMTTSLVAFLNIRLREPKFSGCVKNKLANPEIIQPIADFVADFLFEKIEADEKATKELIKRFYID